MIREAQDSDIDRMVEIGAVFAAQAYPEIEYDADSFAASLKLLIANEGAIVLVSDHGMAAALVFPMFFNFRHFHCQELFWWDSGGEGKSLLRAMENAARERGAETMSMICVDTLRPETVAQIYTRAGYRPGERAFLKEL